VNVSEGSKPIVLNGQPAAKKVRLNPSDTFVIGGYELTVFTKDA
jgi:hypothetical protein